MLLCRLSRGSLLTSMYFCRTLPHHEAKASKSDYMLAMWSIQDLEVATALCLPALSRALIGNVFDMGFQMPNRGYVDSRCDSQRLKRIGHSARSVLQAVGYRRSGH